MTRYMYLDAAAILVQLILIFNTFYRKMYIRKNGKLFLLNTLVCMFASIFDIFSAFPNLVGFDGSYFCSTWYFIFRAFMPVTYLLYTIEFVDPRREKSRSNRFFILLLLPYFVLLLLIIINPSLPHSISIFYYEIINGVITYFRGPLIYLIYAISIFYIVLVLAYIVIYSKFFNLPELVALVSIIPLSIASVIIQFLNKNLLIELFTSTLALILVQSVIERKEKLLDPRTGLRNKNIFLDHIKRSYAFKRQCYIISITISNFNEIFNIFSYDGANNYINTITHTLDKKYRDYNQNYYTYCIDNGIYAIVIDKLYDAKQIAKQILNDMSYNEMVISKYHPKLSICIIDSPNDFESYDTLDRFITRYHSNFKNDNQITIVSEVKNNNDFIIKNNLDEIIDTAFKNNEFDVYYQPIINMKENKFTSCEALVRLKSEKYGFISPALFIPYAEKNGKITDIDNLVIEKVFKFISSKNYKKLNLEYIEINLSMVDCMDYSLADRILYLMDKYKISPSSINFEITESYETLDNEISKENIRILEEHGIKFSLDDYGTGYSNIERFADYPIKIVKIDKSLVDYAYDNQMKLVLKNTFKLIKELNRKTVVEGVETEEQVLIFKEFDCDYIQGYYFSKPLPLNDFITFMEEKK